MKPSPTEAFESTDSLLIYFCKGSGCCWALLRQMSSINNKRRPAQNHCPRKRLSKPLQKALPPGIRSDLVLRMKHNTLRTMITWLQHLAHPAELRPRLLRSQFRQ